MIGGATVNNTVHRHAPMPVMVVNGDFLLLVTSLVMGSTDELLVNMHTSNGFSTRIRIASELGHDMEAWSTMAKRCSTISYINNTMRDNV